MRVDRLKRLISILEAVEREEKLFNLNVWADPEAEPFEFDEQRSDERVVGWAGDRDEICGTSACAGGYAAMDPVFYEQGLRLKGKIGGNYFVFVPDIHTGLPSGIYGVGITYTDETGVEHRDFEAAAVFFDIAVLHAFYLFDPGAYRDEEEKVVVSPRMVIERIEEIIG